MWTAARYCCCNPSTKLGEHTSFSNVFVCVPLPVKFVVAIILQIIGSYNEIYFLSTAPTHLGSLRLYGFNTIYITASSRQRSIIYGAFKTVFCVTKHVKSLLRAELCDTFGIFTGAMALNFKDRDDKWHDTIKKNGRNRQRSPNVLFCH